LNKHSQIKKKGIRIGKPALKATQKKITTPLILVCCTRQLRDCINSIVTQPGSGGGRPGNSATRMWKTRESARDPMSAPLSYLAMRKSKQQILEREKMVAQQSSKTVTRRAQGCMQAGCQQGRGQQSQPSPPNPKRFIHTSKLVKS